MTEYYFTIKLNRVLICAVIWMKLENFTLNERNLSQNTTYCMTPFILNV